MEPAELPNHFTDEEILRAQRVAISVDASDDDVFIREGPRNRGAFSLAMGLLMRLNTGIFSITFCLSLIAICRRHVPRCQEKSHCAPIQQ